MENLTFVTGWFRRHGMAYLDMVLGSLEEARLRERLGEAPLRPGELLVERRDQYAVAATLGYDNAAEGRPLRAVDRVVVLVPKDGQGQREFRVGALVTGKWPRIRESVLSVRPDLGPRLDDLQQKIRDDEAFPPLEWLEASWKGDERLLWHLINEAPFETQLAWYTRHSPVFQANREHIQFAELNVSDVESPEDVTQAMHAWLEQHGRGDRLLVNLWATTTAVQFGWYYLAWRRPALKSAVFLKCEDDKQARVRRFAPITIEVVNKDPIASLSRPPSGRIWESDDRKRARNWLTFYVEQDDNFSILLLGERGTGKSEAVSEAWKNTDRKGRMISANCANFRDATHARSELFGHVKGAYTDGRDDRDGLLAQAHGGLLFLDEVHHLDMQTRSMLLTALQTDRDGMCRFTKLGGTKEIRVKFQPVFASNRPWDDLSRLLEPDFLDRIRQRILQWPRIAPSELQGAWNNVWDRMKFKGPGVHNPADEGWFLEWLAAQELPGNFRDLQRIAILVVDYQRVVADTRDDRGLIRSQMTLQEYLVETLSGLSSREGTKAPSAALSPAKTVAQPSIVVPFDPDDPDATDKTYLAECRRQFVVAMTARFRTHRATVEFLRRRGSGMTTATFSRWSGRARA